MKPPLPQPCSPVGSVGWAGWHWGSAWGCSLSPRGPVPVQELLVLGQALCPMLCQPATTKPLCAGPAPHVPSLSLLCGPGGSSSSSHHLLHPQLLRLPHDLPVGHIPPNLSPHWDAPFPGVGTGQPSLSGELPHLPQEVHHPGRSPSPFIHTAAITSGRQENRGPGSCEISQHSTGQTMWLGLLDSPMPFPVLK